MAGQMRMVKRLDKDVNAKTDRPERDPLDPWWETTAAFQAAEDFNTIVDQTAGQVADDVIGRYRLVYRTLDPDGQTIFRARVITRLARSISSQNELPLLRALWIVNEWFPKAP